MVKRTFYVAFAVLVALLGSAAQAWADPPAWGGPSQVEVTPLVDDPLSLLCGDRVVTFTDGELITRTRHLPDGSIRDVRIPVNAVANDQFGMTYRLHGSGSSSGTETSGTFRLTGALIASNGSAETVHLFLTYSPTDFTVQDTGTCSVEIGG
jgi:hypothetical protein